MRIEPVIRGLSRILIPVCYVGMTASLGIHVFTLAWHRTVPSSLAISMTLGVFVVGIPTILIMRWLSRDIRPKDLREQIRVANPTWLRRFSMGSRVYFVLVFALLVATSRAKHAGGATIVAGILPIFSAAWLGFYASLADYPHLGLRGQPMKPRCPNGHRVDLGAGYCSECGSLVRQVTLDHGA